MEIAQPTGSPPLPEPPVMEVVPAPTTEEIVEAESEEHFEPRGAFLFTSLMLAGFAVYFFLVWLEFTTRGGA